jgi:[protein-PII] uridylyltransferase
VSDALAHPELSGADAVEVAQARKSAAIEKLGGPARARVLDTAPRRYLLAHEPATIAKHARMLETHLAKNEVRIQAEPGPTADSWTVHIVAHDQPGTLAAIGRAFARCDIPIVRAWISTWDNGVAVDVFEAVADRDVDWDALRIVTQVAIADRERNGGPEPIDGTLVCDNAASPWQTIVEVRADDRAGLLHRVADAFSRAGISIHYATVQTTKEVAVDTFFVTDRDGHKLDPVSEHNLRLAFEGKPLGRRMRGRRIKRSAVS